MQTQQGAAKIMDWSDELATYSAMQGGLTRAYLTTEHKQAHQQIAHWMSTAGLQTWQDSVGNQWGRKVSTNSTLPTLIIGSHSDTVTNAGKYDGNLGILLAIEALDQLQEEALPFHVDVVAFADEEGTRFNTTLIGSSATAGCFDNAWLAVEDAQGISMAHAMSDFGLAPDLAGSDSRSREETLAYLEVHIEQGPVLEAKDLPVGVVTGIAGAKRYQFKLFGMAGHAGTVPINLRNDALCGAAQMISTIEEFAKQHGIVATVGKCELISDAVNVIPGEVHFSLDIRSQCQTALDNCCEMLLAQLSDIAAQRQLELHSENIYQAEAVLCSDSLQQYWSDVVEEHTKQNPCLLTSGAGHDAMVMTNITDIGMLFVRCEKGISHHPKEQVMQADVAVALNCLVDMVKKLSIEAVVEKAHEE
ncbi:Zn-dependent hydrolase [Vibrio sp. 10N.286.49.B3]|uniref:allantoate amidohydrolase n=1 Tax=Vibrio sp. 10N.286.49.B3 TaxID=1880855 RepID=UPI000C84CC7F|nr:allantoate amidohydrolase [Vibrio sp. 10N.286.49.B3]PMH44452.1 Zn-dependent hydrolase [Vibrio sp. 10N.286.49.B3]